MGIDEIITRYYFSSFQIMGLVDLSYTLSEKDRSIWPGNLPFKLTTVREGSDNDMNCFISMVRFDTGCPAY